MNLLCREVAFKLKIVKFIREVTNDDINGFGKWNTEPVKSELFEDNDPHCLFSTRKIPIPLMSQLK